MVWKQTSKMVFVEGRGGGRGLPKTDQEVTSQESEIYEDGKIFPSQDGLMANDCGGRPIYATGEETPFHSGRGPGRGHGPDAPKNA